MSYGTVCAYCKLPIYQIGESWHLLYSDEDQTQGAVMCRKRDYSMEHEPTPAEQPHTIPKHIQTYYEEGGIAPVAASPAKGPRQHSPNDLLRLIREFSAHKFGEDISIQWTDDLVIEFTQWSLAAQPVPGAAKVEEIAAQLHSAMVQLAPDDSEIQIKQIAAILRPYFPEEKG